jgi:hypothetical protein
MQADGGNLALYYGNQLTITIPVGWSAGRGGHYATMQDDGNFCVYKANNTWHWTSQTGGRARSLDYKLVLGDDGSLNIHGSQGALIRNLYTDYCPSGGGRPALPYFACRRGLPPYSQSETIVVTATCGVEARNLAMAQGAGLGACTP